MIRSPRPRTGPASRAPGSRRPRRDGSPPGRTAPRPAHDAGQASVEHAALVALVAALLVAGGMLVWAPSIVNAVHSGIRRAICVAGGDTCAPFHAQQPCLEAKDVRSHSNGVRILVVRVGGTETLEIERRSDGTYRVTSYRESDGGIGLSIGGRFGLGRSTEGDEELVEASGGKGGWKPFEAEASAEAHLRGGWGQVWDLRDRGAMEAFVRRYEAGDRGHRGDGSFRRGERPPDVEVVRVGVDGSLTGSVSGPLGVASASATAMAGIAGEGARDRRTGEVTVSLALPLGVAAELAGPVGLSLDGSLAVESSATVVLDRDMHPKELRLAGRLTTKDGTRVREVQTRLDLTSSGLADRLGDLTAGLRDRSPGRTIEAARALGRYTATDGWVDEREYKVATSQDGTDLDLSVGGGFGYHDQDLRTLTRLADARTRPPGGVWESRPDCGTDA